MTDESLYKRKEKGREAFVPATVSEGGQAEENLESFVLKPLYTRKERRSSKKETVSETYLELRGRRFGRLKIWKNCFLYGRKRRKMRLAVGRSP